MAISPELRAKLTVPAPESEWSGYDMRELIERACKYVNVIPYTNFNFRNDYRALVNYIDKTYTAEAISDFQNHADTSIAPSEAYANGNKAGKWRVYNNSGLMTQINTKGLNINNNKLKYIRTRVYPANYATDITEIYLLF